MNMSSKNQKPVKICGYASSQIGAQSSKPQKKNMKMTFMPQEVIKNSTFTSKTEGGDERPVNLSHSASSNSSKTSSSNNNDDNGDGNIITICTYVDSNDTIKELNPKKLFEANLNDIAKSIEQSKRRSSYSGMGIDKHYINSKNILNSISNENKAKNDDSPINGKIAQSKTFMRQQSISPFDIINQHDNEVKSMTNTIEISNFYDYTESCMRMIVEISGIKYTNPAKVTFDFDNSGDVKKRLAVFDLDETLVHCLVKDCEKSKNIIEVPLPSKNIAKIGVNIRPHWQEALKRIQKKYHIVIYTASHKSYADAVLDFLDPENKFFAFRLYRNNCIMINHDNKILYIKDCSIFNDYDLKDVILVDNSVLSFAYHLDNGIPIVPYYDAKQDFELLFCACYLEYIYSYEDFRLKNKELLKLDNLLTHAINEIQEEKEKKRKKKLKAQTPSTKSRTLSNSNAKLLFAFNNKANNVASEKPSISCFCNEFKYDLQNLRNKFKNNNEINNSKS